MILSSCPSVRSRNPRKSKSLQVPFLGVAEKWSRFHAHNTDEYAAPFKVSTMVICQCCEAPHQAMATHYFDRTVVIGCHRHVFKTDYLDLTRMPPLQYFAALFSTHFWDEVMPKAGQNALHPRREVGQFFNENSLKNMEPLHFTRRACNETV